MFPLLVALMVVLPFAEIFVLIQVGEVIGGWWVLGILVAEAILGAWLMQHEGTRAWKALNQTFATGKMPAGELADTALILVGGVLLMVPGFISDIVGLVFLLPFTRPLARKLLAYVVARRMARLGLSQPGRGPGGQGSGSGTVIEGETVADPQPGTRTDEDPASPSSGPVIIAGEIENGRDRDS